jgi:pseudaminic acid biosynthesis-associated methylase
VSEFRTEQEAFWAGKFGDEYVSRNSSDKLLSIKTGLFSRMLTKATDIKSCIEFGSNIGLNLIAIQRIVHQCEISAIEINATAVKELEKIEGIKVYNESILDYKNDYKRDLAFVAGVLIHINPSELDLVYENIYNSSRRYILISEYYNPTPVEVMYRGNTGKLFKRDFAGEMLDKYPDLRLVDYGFVYHRDGMFPDDDWNWFLLSK